MLEFHAETLGSLTIEDLDASDLSRRNLWGDIVDQLLAQEHVNDLISELDGETLWALTDNLGSVRDMVDSDGNARVHRQFDSFGNIVDEDYLDSEGDPLSPGWFGYETLAFGYTGRPLDETTGLQNNLNRWYDASTGRWMSEDPIGFAAGDANLYRYVGNEPTGWIDPSGLSPPFGPPGFPGGRNPITEIKKIVENHEWPVNSVVKNSTNQPIWAGSPGRSCRWVDPGEQTSDTYDDGDFYFYNGQWYKVGWGTVIVRPGDQGAPYKGKVTGKNDPGLPLPPRVPPGSRCEVGDWF